MNIKSAMKETFNQMILQQTNYLKNLKKSELFITKREFDEVHIYLYYDELNQIVFYTYQIYDYISISTGDYEENDVDIYLNNKLFYTSIVDYFNYVNQDSANKEVVFDSLFSKVMNELYNINVLHICASNYYSDLDFNIKEVNKELGLNLKLKCNKFKSISKTDSKEVNELIKGMSIKTWFQQNDATEYSIPYMNPKTTFEDVYKRPHLADELISVYETAVREIVFDILSDVYEVDYVEIYNRWEDQFKFKQKK